MEEKNYYIYRHLKPNGEVFYVGLSRKKNRAYHTLQRSSFWKKLVSKYPDYEVQILKTGLTKEEAVEMEIILISWYGRRDIGTGTLVNLTDGGDGTTNVSEETRIKRSKVWLGKKHTDETLYKLRGENNYYAKKVINVKKLKIYGCLNIAAENENLAPTYLSQMMRGLAPNTTDCMFLSDYEKGKEIKKDVRKRKVKILDTATGIIYNSIREAAKATGVVESSLYQYIRGARTNKTTLIALKDE